MVLQNSLASTSSRHITLSKCKSCSNGIVVHEIHLMLSQSSWCTLIAKRTFILQHGNRAANQQPVSYTGMLTMLATSAYRFVMVFTSLVVSFALGSVPLVGPLAGFVFLCWVDA